MTHLDSITIHNFKSFRHVNIKFSKGFNCIVGANGSGKSNICDSLLFALGEISLKRMRVPNTTLLINSFAKPKREDGIKKAYVKINFAADNPLEISRIIKSNNKISYRLNSKRVTRQEVVDALRGYKSEINDTNIIAQNEISYMVNLNAKERRELIDIAAGIKEFNDKKDAAMKELDKVQEKINESQIMLNERRGFLDQLEKEKEDAEKYLQLTDTVKRINYTILKNSEKQAEYDFNNTSDALRGAEQRKAALSGSIKEIDLMIEKLSKDKETLAKDLNERSIELSRTNKLLETINKETAVKEMQIKSLKEKLEENESQIAQSNAEQKKLREGSAAVAEQSRSVQEKLDVKASELISMDALETGTDSASQLSRIGQNQKMIDELYAKSESDSKQYLQYMFEIDELEKSLRSKTDELAPKEEELSRKQGEAGDQKKKMLQLDENVLYSSKELEAFQKHLANNQGRIDALYGETVAVREQIAMLGGSSDRRINDFLKRNIGQGFHGRAYELCTFDEKYSLAVNSAGQSRLNYLVVDSAETADKAIKLLKSRQMGRASFIPLKDLAVKRMENDKKLDSLIDHIEFNDKFAPAFNYIFANTYIANSISEAKSIGFGKGRFVTLEGEVVEQSGIITGGSIKNQQSPAILESKLRAAEEQKHTINDDISKINATIERKRNEMAASQVESMNCRVELKHLDSDIKSLKSYIETSKLKMEEINARLEQLNTLHNESGSKNAAIIDEINALKAENEKIYSLTPSRKSKTDKAEAEKLKTLRAEVEQLRISIATMSKEQEMKSARLQEVENEIKTRSAESKETRKKIAIIDNELLELGKNLNEMRQKVGKSDANSQELYRKIQELDVKLGKLGADKGKFNADTEKSSRELIEQETRKVQLQTRINDIKAELLSYNGIEAIKGQTQQEMESKRTIAKSDLERLGAVNLKAPEVYELKKKDVEEASAKLNILGSERDSIIAMINEIESKKLSIFSDTLNEVNQNFERLYGYIFEGSAHLHLENPKDPFNSGLAVNIKSPKNRNSSVETLSGGEKSLVIIMLIFAIQANNPMSLYVFDEIDASLDKENSKKLSKLMLEMSKKSQLIVISHNDSLITAADTAIGVVHRNGESRVVGLRLSPTQIEAKQ